MKVLIIDDSKITREHIKKELSTIKNIELLEAETGENGIKQVIKELPDIITMDINMPDIDGITAATKIRKYPNCSNIPLIFITGSTDIKIREKAFEAGAVEFFQKPFEPGTLKKYIEELLIKEDLLNDLNILVVEDSRQIQELITRILTDKGANVLLAGNGEEGIEVLQNDNVDLIITDVLMPRMGGIDLCIHVRQVMKNVEIPIIAITAFGNYSVGMEVFNAGANDYLTKPFTREELITRVINHSRLICLHKKLHDEINERTKKEVELQHHRENLEELVEKRTAELSKALSRLKIFDKAKSNFLKLISHEFRTPLNGLCVTTELLMDEDCESNGREELIEAYQESKDRLLHILDEALLLMKIENAPEGFPIKANSLQDAITIAIDMTIPLAESKQVYLQYDLCSSVSVMSEEFLLIKVLSSALTIAVNSSNQSENVIISCKETGKEVTIEINSFGLTVPEEKILTFFDIFTTLSEQAADKNIVLEPLVADNVMKLFHGEISVENRGSSGITLALRFLRG